MIMSCGTEVGNPLTALNNEGSDDPVDSDASLSLFSSNLETGVCTKLFECYSSTLSKVACLNAISIVDGFDTELGLDGGNYNSLSDIKTAESSSLITPDSTSSSQCLSDISALVCTDSEVINAYDISNSTNYSSFYLIVPSGAGSCNDVF
jgi:hypothetical protein